MIRPPRLVVFDVDGTLIDSQAHILLAMSAAFDWAGLAMPARQDVLGVVGLSLPLAISRLVPEAPAATIDGMVTRYKDAFGAHRDTQQAPPYPGAMETLHHLASQPDTLLGIATGKSRRGLNHLLDLHGLHGMFQTTQVADDHPSKPHPAMLLAALRETRVHPTAATMIGDTSYDIEMARSAGLRAIGVSWGYHDRAALLRAGAERVIESYEDLAALLDMQESP
jgi:phosphoglycolate phosphatase